MGLLRRYTNWLHTRWPAGTLEKLPEVRSDGTTNVAGLYIVGDLTGIPLLKFSSDSGARAVAHVLADSGFKRSDNDEVFDLIILGAGVSGMAAALAAKKAGLRFCLLEAVEPFSTILNFPKHKPIYTYPTDMVPAGDLQFTATVKEPLVEELRQQARAEGIEPRHLRAERVVRRGGRMEVEVAGADTLVASRVIVGIGRSGNFRKLGVPGEDKDKVSNRLHDPKDYCDKDVLIVGGGDSAMEAAIAIASCGGRVTLSYRKPEFSRPKPENIDAIQRLAEDPMADVAVEQPTSERVTTAAGGFLDRHKHAGSIRLAMASQVQEIAEDSATLKTETAENETIPNDAVFTMIGREAPLQFFRRSGVRITGELDLKNWVLMLLFLAFCVFVYNWKAGGELTKLFQNDAWFPFNFDKPTNPASFWGTLHISLGKPGFYYTFIYSLVIVLFGITRIRRRKTPYIKAQTLTLMAVQVLPLFLLPYLILPYLGHNGAFDSGFFQTVGDNLFPATTWDAHGREYWRAFGFILAWPLFIWNFFTDQPMTWWLVIGCVQTFVLIPLMVFKWGKGAYCGWICSCGALAETLGDTHRHKMPHGPIWNRLNMVGQLILWIAMLMFVMRIISWSFPDTAFGDSVASLYAGLLNQSTFLGVQLNYYWIVDVLLAGIIGVGLYFWFSGRIWCRFACPLAALMHIYARFSRFRIFSEKKKCISCNVCTSVCHQGIDVMNFANKGLPMEDPECVRCSACVQSCPTGVLSFGEIDPKTGDALRLDRIAASPVQMAEKRQDSSGS